MSRAFLIQTKATRVTPSLAQMYSGFSSLMQPPSAIEIEQRAFD
jgi:hypothetical protein